MPVPASGWPLATVGDVEARLGRALADEAEQTRADALLEDASNLVAGYLGTDFADESVPSAVAGVTAQMVARALTVPVTTYRTEGGPMLYSGGVYLSAADKQALRLHRVSAVGSIELTSERDGSSSLWWA